MREVIFLHLAHVRWQMSVMKAVAFLVRIRRAKRIGNRHTHSACNHRERLSEKSLVKIAWYRAFGLTEREGTRDDAVRSRRREEHVREAGEGEGEREEENWWHHKSKPAI